MILLCVWEHNKNDTLLYAQDYPGAFTRGATLKEAMAKMPDEIRRFQLWLGLEAADEVIPVVAQEQSCDLAISDADSDVLFASERPALTLEEYEQLKATALRSAADFLTLFHSIPDENLSVLPERATFYGSVPRTARQMLDHTQHVNAYYFSEIGVDADNEGTLLSCREQGFSTLEKQPDFLSNRIFEGSYGESWSLRKVLRRFVWHDRIHARAMYRMACQTFPSHAVADPFFFG